MNSRHQQDLEGLVEHLRDAVEAYNGIISELREILAREAPDREIVRDARLALAAWYGSTYPHLYPGQGRPQLRVIRGPFPYEYTADRPCPQCQFVVPVQVVVQSPGVIGYRCDREHMWLAGMRD